VRRARTGSSTDACSDRKVIQICGGDTARDAHLIWNVLLLLLPQFESHLALPRWPAEATAAAVDRLTSPGGVTRCPCGLWMGHMQVYPLQGMYDSASSSQKMQTSSVHASKLRDWLIAARLR
jgi:hypothetical protein